VSTRCPASLLALHPDAAVYCDRDAAARAALSGVQRPAGAGRKERRRSRR